VFKSGRDFAAWLGLTPRQNSSGGKQTLGGITKQGNRYIRKMLVLGATSLLNVLGKRKGALRDWIVGLLAKKPARLVTVALANKLARIVFWAMIEDRRMLPHRNVCEGVRKQFAAARRVYRFTGSSLASATKRDERHGRHRRSGTARHAPRA